MPEMSGDVKTAHATAHMELADNKEEFLSVRVSAHKLTPMDANAPGAHKLTTLLSMARRRGAFVSMWAA